MDSHNDTFETADRLGLAVMQSMENMDVSSTQSMIDEYQDLWKSIQKRLREYRASLAAATTTSTSSTTSAKEKPSKKNKKKRQQELQQQQQQQQAAVVEPKVEVVAVAAAAAQPTLVNESVQVSTLKFETDRAVQVDTLPPLMRLTSKEGYQMELDAALQECSDNMDTLHNAIQSSTPQIAEATIAANNLVRTDRNNFTFQEQQEKFLKVYFFFFGIFGLKSNDSPAKNAHISDSFAFLNLCLCLHKLIPTYTLFPHRYSIIV